MGRYTGKWQEQLYPERRDGESKGTLDHSKNKYN